MPRKSKKILKDITITGLHPSGRTFGYWGDRKVYIDNALVGETVDVEISSHQRNWLSGNLLQIKTQSAHRVKPFCKHADICGGCIWQHIAYNHQLQLKKQIVENFLSKQKLDFPPIADVVASPQTTYFRNKLDFSFSSRRWYYEDEGKVIKQEDRVAMGFHPAHMPEKVFNIDECYLLQEPALAIAMFVKEYALQHGIPFHDPKENTGLLHSVSVRISSLFEIIVNIVFTEAREDTIKPMMQSIRTEFPQITLLCYEILNLTHPDFSLPTTYCSNTQTSIKETSNGLVFEYGKNAFYQPNPKQAEIIYTRIKEIAALKGTENIIDLYCGIGTISLILASKAKHVTGIEGNLQAVENAGNNASVNNVENATFICGDILQTFTPAFLNMQEGVDLIILDPPRAGTLINIKKTILASGAKQVIYLSCNPESLATDLKMLCEKYTIASIEPYDMFPHTAHVETLVLLKLKKEAE